jgi:PAS domain S-box-containing protein
VLHTVPAAVLVVDTTIGAVTYANPVARELSKVRLPCPARMWASGARLMAEVRGDPRSPVERAAAGLPVDGEIVVAPGARGRPIVLWATAVPLPDVGGLHGSTLVVLLPVDTGVGSDEPSYDVHNRALVAAGLSFTISNPHLDDNPIVWVNPAFLAMTGYEEKEVLGRNCRFLQGPDTDPAAVEVLRLGQRERRPAQVTLLNYRKDGVTFWNEVTVSPVLDGLGRLTHFVGVQADVTQRVEAQLLREELLSAERAARAEAERVQERLRLLADATERLVATLDIDEALSRLVELAVPRLADWCVVHLLADSSGSPAASRVVGAHVDPSAAGALRTVERLASSLLTESAPIRRVIANGVPVFLPEVSEADVEQYSKGELRAAYRALGHRSAVVVPLAARRQVLGALALVTSTSGRVYTEDDVQLAADLARRVALIVDNARLYRREHEVAEALQRSMLPPELPAIPGLDVASRYLPGSVGAQVGGDWYDLLHLPDGAVGLAIGDVMGHDMAAAAAMGQLRSVLRSYAWQRQSPGEVLDSLDQLVQGLDMAQLATAVFARLTFEEDPEGRSTGAANLTYANAGHLPPMVWMPDGSVHRLDGGWSVLIGAPAEEARRAADEFLPPGATLVLYTDGLVESRESDVETGLVRLAEVLAKVGGAATADAVADGLLAGLQAEVRNDDAALLVVRLVETIGALPAAGGRVVVPGRLPMTGSWQSELVLPSEPSSARSARRFLRRQLGGLPEEVRASALLLCSELVSNAVTHGSGDLRVAVDRAADVVRVAVEDANQRLPVRRELTFDEPGMPPERGRGLVLLDAMASRWGAERSRDGKWVWFELDL